MKPRLDANVDRRGYTLLWQFGCTAVAVRANGYGASSPLLLCRAANLLEPAADLHNLP